MARLEGPIMVYTCATHGFVSSTGRLADCDECGEALTPIDDLEERLEVVGAYLHSALAERSALIDAIDAELLTSLPMVRERILRVVGLVA